MRKGMEEMIQEEQYHFSGTRSAAKRFFWSAISAMAILFMAAACTSSSVPQDTIAGPYEGTLLEGAAPDFQLIDQNGRAVALSDFRGQVVVLAFLDSQCQEVCPLTAVHLRTAYDALGDGQVTAVDPQSVVFLGVNVNVEANEVGDVAASTEKWRLNEIDSWHFLTGDAGELQPVWKAYNVSAIPAEDEAEELLHTSGVYIIDREGQMRWYISTPFDDSGTSQWTAPLSDLLVKQIRALLREG